MKKRFKSLILAGAAALTLSCGYGLHLDNRFRDEQSNINLECNDRRLLEDYATVEVLNGSRNARGNIYIIKQRHASSATGEIDSLSALIQTEIYRIGEKLYEQRRVRKFYTEGLLPGEATEIERDIEEGIKISDFSFLDPDDEAVFNMIYTITNEAGVDLDAIDLLNLRYRNVEIKGSEDEKIRNALIKYYDYLEYEKTMLEKYENELKEIKELMSVVKETHYIRSYKGLEACMKDVYYENIRGRGRTNVAMVIGGSHQNDFRKLCATGELGRYNIVLVTPLDYRQ